MKLEQKSKIMLTLYNVVSFDGFIARNNSDEDFIPDDLSLWQNFLNLCLKYQSLIIGRKTYETIQRYNQPLLSSFENLPIKKIIVSSNKDLVVKNGYILVNSPEEAFRQEQNALVSSGPNLNNYLLEHGYVGEIIQYKLPVSIKDGIKPFNQNKLDAKINITVHDWAK